MKKKRLSYKILISFWGLSLIFFQSGGALVAYASEKNEEEIKVEEIEKEIEEEKEGEIEKEEEKEEDLDDSENLEDEIKEDEEDKENIIERENQEKSDFLGQEKNSDEQSEESKDNEDLEDRENKIEEIVIENPVKEVEGEEENLSEDHESDENSLNENLDNLEREESLEKEEKNNKEEKKEAEQDKILEKECIEIEESNIKESDLGDWKINKEQNIAETKEVLELGVKYIFPLEEKVTVTFYCLPEDSKDRSTLKIEKINKEEVDLPENLEIIGDYVFDITTEMKDGDFEYELTLPTLENLSEGDELKTFYVEDKKDLNDKKQAKEIEKENIKIDKEKNELKVEKLDHFTVFYNAVEIENKLVINEFDYDQPGTDDGEFIELKNISGDDVNLQNYGLKLINGSNNEVYKIITLEDFVLQSGDYYVICGDSNNVPNCDLDLNKGDFFQNGAPDAIALYKEISDEIFLVDAVSYEGEIADYFEGEGIALEDNDSLGFSRYPDGQDTNNNKNDFVLSCLTPGEENCKEVIVDEIESGSLSDWSVNYPSGNPAFYYEEIVSPYDGSIALRTSVIGSSYSPCNQPGISKTYLISGNTNKTQLKAYLAFTSTMEQYTFPYVVVELYDESGERVGYQIYYGKDVIGGLYASYANNNPENYTELPTAEGNVTLDLSVMGEDINFNSLKITLANYACVGRNSVVFDHLKVINGNFKNGENNISPVAHGSSFIVESGQTYSGKVAGSDDDNDSLSFNLVNAPIHGKILFYADGNFEYTSDEDFFGGDSFSFVANDGLADSNIGVVNITVEEVPPALGSSDNPASITNCEELQNINNNNDWHYELKNDIDCSESKNWNSGNGFLPIGEFYGFLNGNNFNVSDVFVNTCGSGGVFLSNYGSIKNINFRNLDVSGGGYTGGLVNYNPGLIEKSSITGKVSCGSQQCGGFAGKNSGQISESWADIEINGPNYVGVIVGHSHGGQIKNCYAKGKMNSSSQSGGLVGLNESTTVIDSYSTSEIRESLNNGGLIGWMYQHSSQSGSYWNKEISGFDKMCGTQSHSGSGCNNENGLTDAEMKNTENFVGWDFENIWAINPEKNDGYPYLQWQTTFSEKDTEAPMITLLGDSIVEIVVGDTYVDAGATALDNVDGDITDQIIVNNLVDTSTVGTYTVTYNVTDANGNSAIEVIRIVNVIEENVVVEDNDDVQVEDENYEPDSVDGLEAEYNSDKKCVKLSWDLDDDRADKVKIYRSLESSFPTDTSTKIQDQDADDENYNDCDVEEGNKYYYKVVVIEKNDEESNSEKVSIEIDESEEVRGVVLDQQPTSENQNSGDEEEGDNENENEEPSSGDTSNEDGDDENNPEVLGEVNESNNPFILFLKQWWIGLVSFIALGVGWYVSKGKIR